MARGLSYYTLSMFSLVVLVFLPMASLCEEETYKSMIKQKAQKTRCVKEDAELKRFDDTDYDSFVSLMGRRSAAEPNSYKNTPVLRRRLTFPCPEEYQQTKSWFINRERQRSQRIL